LALQISNSLRFVLGTVDENVFFEREPEKSQDKGDTKGWQVTEDF